MKNQKTILLIVIIAILGGALYYFLQRQQQREAQNLAQDPPKTVGESVVDLWGTFTGKTPDGRLLTDCSGMTPEERTQIENSGIYACSN